MNDIQKTFGTGSLGRYEEFLRREQTVKQAQAYRWGAKSNMDKLEVSLKENGPKNQRSHGKILNISIINNLRWHIKRVNI